MTETDNAVVCGNGGDGGVEGFHWTLSNWSHPTQAARKRTNSNIRVDLASPEDISLDTDSSRAVFNPYGTTV